MHSQTIKPTPLFNPKKIARIRAIYSRGDGFKIREARYECELPRFGPGKFLKALQGKTMAFIGDSVARNQLESLLCLLSTVETPKQLQKDPENRFTTWEFPKHNFTLMALWSPYLVSSTERVVNGSATSSFDLHLDRVDPNWSEKLPLIDYAIFSDAHWFFRLNYLYEDSKLVGCVYCQSPNVPDLGPGLAIRKAFRAAFRAINDCRNCRKIFSFLRTYSPSHFENGTWNTGGGCNRKRPVGRDEVVGDSGPNWEYRKIQVEEIGIARSAGEESGNSFGVLDVTEIMSMRRDGHPGVHKGNKWMKDINDCIHWCLPGPVDVWNELLFELIKRQIRVSSESEVRL
ncbi:protein altered xyloglucan 4-like [Phtheirospermum japonicum]|uniref:Protein altered xyloglucan 4-like n=1 Tax=Phtheirospermum japonicum TaxID=374723 RepID=A0A830CSQ8_9LAMI|nr:protein altered xyloglucan 4-like [Phtheirospermum japonicum]